MKKEVNIDITILPKWEREKGYARLQAWFIDTLDKTSDSMMWKDSFCKQVVFVRDDIVALLNPVIKSLDVISTHVSKSITLPVYKIELTDGTEIIMRENFYDWKVSVKSSKELNFPTKYLFSYDINVPISPCYCEGFDDSWVYEPYSKNKKNFTVELSSNYDLYTFMFLILNQI